MLVKVLIVFLFFFIIIRDSKQTYASNIVKTNLSGVLNALLGHPQWKQLSNVRVKYPDFTNQSFSFSGKDLFINRGWFSRANNIGNSDINHVNVFKIYYQITYLLGCVYANATDTFTTLIKDILSVSRRERRLLTKNKYRKRTKENRLEKKAGKQGQCKRSKTEVQDLQNGKKNDNSENEKENKTTANDKVNYCEPSPDQLNVYANSWKIFNYTYQQMLDSQKMFKYMYDALIYLFRLIPLEKCDLHLNMRDIKHILLTVMWYKDVSTNLKKLFPTYGGEHDSNYKTKVSIYFSLLLRYINRLYQYNWKPFVDNYCILPVKENKDIKIMMNQFQIAFPDRKKTDIIYQFGTQIQDLVNNVINNYYLNLGFVYMEELHFMLFTDIVSKLSLLS